MGVETSPLSVRIRVLLLESDPTLRRLLQEVLQVEGYEVFAVAETSEAFALARGGRFDLVVASDGPRESTSIALHEALAADGVDAPVLAICAPRSDTARQGLDRGVADFLLRPLTDLDLFLVRVRSVLGAVVDGRRFDPEVGRLVAAIRSHPQGREAVKRARADLEALRNHIRRDASVALLIPDIREREAHRQELDAAGVRPVPIASEETLLELVSRPQHPQVVVIDADRPGVMSRIESLHRADPLLEVIAVSRRRDPEELLPAIEAGAGEAFLRFEECWPAFLGRVRRALQRVHRRRIFKETAFVLHRVATELGVEVEAADAAEQVADDRRHARRHPVDLYALMELEGVEIPTTGRLRDLSQTGLFVAIDPPPQLGERLTVEILRSDGVIRAQGEVVRVVRLEPDPEGRTGVGVRIDSSDRRLLGTLLGGKTASA